MWRARRTMGTARLLLFGLVSATMLVMPAGGQGQLPGSDAWVPTTAADAAIVTQCSQYTIGLMNLRKLLLQPTTLERVIAAYKSPYTTLAGVPIAQRYWLVMQVNEGGDSYITMMETYQDDLKNWQTVIPSATKNFKAEGRALTNSLEAEVWFARFPQEEVIKSSLIAARLYMEKSHYPLEKPGVTYVLHRLVHSESREQATGPAAVRSLTEERDGLRARISELEEIRGEQARRLAKVLAGKRESLRRAAQRVREGEGLEEGAEARLEKYRQDAADGEEALGKADEEKSKVEKRLERVEGALRQLQEGGGGAATAGLSKPTHVFLVVEFASASDLDLVPLPDPIPSLDRRQIVMYSEDWQRYGTTGWQLLQNHPFDLTTPKTVMPDFVS